ncbi:uncharacterized protein PG986_010240 [Apiospora aurea]|uniref:C3H1-type domain-containing protein n=1 Tax=Apiospora aurea TaxID=335848 RepID=A0ABR1Q9X2_9PEZI
MDDDYIDDPFVAVVVDGDGAIFTDELLKNPALAADKLKVAVRAQLLEMPSLPITIPIVVRIYANLHGLAKTIAANMIINYNDMVDFPSLFNFECDYFDFVDVGRSKEAADSKIRCKQCRRIFLAGVTHDAGYLNDLKELKGDQGNRITLVESYPARSEFKRFGLPIKSFPGVFRTEMLPSAGTFRPRRQSEEQMDQHTTSTDTALVRKNSHPGPVDKASPMQLAPIVREMLQDGGRNRVYYNRNRVRIDKVLQHPGSRYAPHQVSLERKRGGRKGFCNDHYLGGRCKRVNCTLIHDEKLDSDELVVLRWLACTRFSCFNGSDCRDFSCYFPHTCPYPKYECRRDCSFKVHLDAGPDSDDRKPQYVLFDDYGTEMIELED